MTSGARKGEQRRDIVVVRCAKTGWTWSRRYLSNTRMSRSSAELPESMNPPVCAEPSLDGAALGAASVKSGRPAL